MITIIRHKTNDEDETKLHRTQLLYCYLRNYDKDRHSQQTMEQKCV